DAERVVVSSSAFAHHIRHPRSLVYCHTPPRFLYDPEAYFRGRAAARAARAALAPLRRQDRRAALGHVAYVANSEVTARRIAKTYGRVAPVVYPPLATAHLPSRPQPLPSRPRALVVARLLPYKRIEVAIAACAAARIPLTVVGEGPDEPRLRRLASGHVDFAGWLDDDRLAEVFVSHSVVLAPGVEDFGFGPVEASFAGRPVVAVAAGGALETVRDGVTGRLVEGWDPGSWAAAITDVLSRRWSPTDLRGHTTAFGAEVFEGAIRQHLAAV
ncbi:MAG: glycosyltransferase, partial [Acidimicrobiales bacterium]